ncbi:tetraspanin-8-like isoform X2 [Melanotaenia boesemani]|uniref:tetraspanin-8-like isoform X2 n=1 Tax=Melanotaenia boesemani TaxID=1250792 RepID=UPI001C055342|nr:tetraspanin-8-like isoform X2 [Melanotaenia boesemani]
MAQINSCLKYIFIVFNFFFAIVGGVIIGLAVLAHFFANDEVEQNLEDHTAGVIVLYAIGITTMVIAIVGAYGAHKENKVCLVVFQTFMVTGGLVMFRIAIPEVINRPKMEAMLDVELRKMLPLNRAEKKIRNMLDLLQTHMHCCGLFSYKDWEDDIPDSCECTEVVEKYECQNINYRDFYQMKTKSIYSEPCFPIILHYVLMVVDIGLGVFFFLAALAVLGSVMSSIMICQLRPPKRSSVLLATTTISTPEPPKYQELERNPPPY